MGELWQIKNIKKLYTKYGTEIPLDENGKPKKDDPEKYVSGLPTHAKMLEPLFREFNEIYKNKGGNNA